MSVAQKTLITNFKDLEVWQEAVELVSEIYQLCAKLPNSELYGLASQMKRASVSVPSNIAEGHARNHRTEYRQMVFVSVGSLAELETQLLLCLKLQLLHEVDAASGLARIDRLKARLVTLGRRLS